MSTGRHLDYFVVGASKVGILQNLLAGLKKHKKELTQDHPENWRKYCLLAVDDLPAGSADSITVASDKLQQIADGALKSHLFYWTPACNAPHAQVCATAPEKTANVNAFISHTWTISWWGPQKWGFCRIFCLGSYLVSREDLSGIILGAGARATERASRVGAAVHRAAGQRAGVFFAASEASGGESDEAGGGRPRFSSDGTISRPG